jgi:type II secretory pathway pseudopilin PulG
MLTNLHTARNSDSAFSLVEVVVSLGIFVIAVVAVIGLLGPINQSVSAVRDEDDAGGVAQIIQTELQRVPFGTVQGFISGGTILYANRSGTIVAPDADTAKWDLDKDTVVSPEEHANKFFQIELKLDSLLSPNGDQAAYTGGFLAFSILLRWPGYSAEGIPFTQPKQQTILLLPAAVAR